MSSTFQKEKGKRAKSSVSNCMKKGIVSSDEEVKFRFLKSKKLGKKSKNVSDIFSG